MKKVMKKLNIEPNELSKSTFIEECLKAHNKYRTIHGSPRLCLCPEINKYAQEWADTLAERNVFEHRRDCKYGENLFTAFEPDTNWTVMPSDPVKSWYSEIELYTFDNSVIPNNLETGRFTQIIWKNTKKLGIGISIDSSNQVYIVGNYNVPGNTQGQFIANVLPPVKAAKYKHTFIWKRAYPSTHNYKTL